MVLVVYKSMQEVFNGSRFNTEPGHSLLTMSNVISVAVPHTLNKTLLSPANFTIKLKVGFFFFRHLPFSKLRCKCDVKTAIVIL